MSAPGDLGSTSDCLPRSQLRLLLVSQPEQRRQPLPVEAHDDLTVDDRDGCARDAEALQFCHRGRVVRHISSLKRNAMLGEELLHPAAEDSARLVKDHHRSGHRSLPPSRSDPLGTDPPAAGEVPTSLTRQTLREREKIGDARVGHAIDYVLPLPPGCDEATPLQACEVIRDPASRGTCHRNELRDRPLSPQQHIQNVEACRVPQDPEVPRARGQGRCRRWHKGIAHISDRSHVLTVTGFPVRVKRRDAFHNGGEDLYDDQRGTRH